MGAYRPKRFSMVKAPVLTSVPQQQQQQQQHQQHHQPQHFHQFSLPPPPILSGTCSSKAGSRQSSGKMASGGGSGSGISVTTTTAAAIAVVAPTARTVQVSTASSANGGTAPVLSIQQAGAGASLKTPTLQAQRLQPLHHVHHHHHHQLINGIATVATAAAPPTAALPANAPPTAPAGAAWPIVEPVFHFGPGFEPQTRPYCPAHPQPSEHVVLFHVSPGVSVTFQIGNNREIIRGPVTVPMVSQNGTPPMAMPVQVPPGHVMQQIVDENGTLRHVILSTQHQQLGQGGVQHHLHHSHFINGSTPQYFNPLAAGYTAGPGPGGPHIYQSAIIPGAAGQTAAAAAAGGGAGTHTIHTAAAAAAQQQSNVTHSPSPPHSNNNQYHSKDERTQRQHTKLLRKLEQKQRELNAALTTPINSPRKHTEVNGNVRKHQQQQQQHLQLHQQHPLQHLHPVLHQHPHLHPQQQQPNHQQQPPPQAGHHRNGTSSVDTSEDGEESSSMPDEEDDNTQSIVEHLSSVPSPQVNEITSRSALFQWSAPSPLPPNETLPFNVHDLHYELLLSDPGKENKYKSIFKGSSLSCSR